MMSIRPQPSQGFVWAQAPFGPLLQAPALLAVAPHFFTSATLHLREETPEWDAVAAAIGVPRDRLRLVRQVHGRAVAAMPGDAAPGRPEADILITADPETAIVVRVADCTPILIADRARPAVAAVHAGWRGTVERAAQAGVEALAQAFGSHPEDLVAAIGPCLGACCGEVGDEVVEAFRRAGHGDADIARWFTTGPTPKPYLDLVAANRDQLLAAGVPSSSIVSADLCTRTYPSVFHSHRADGPNAGRMAAVIRPTSR